MVSLQCNLIALFSYRQRMKLAHILLARFDCYIDLHDRSFTTETDRICVSIKPQCEMCCSHPLYTACTYVTGRFGICIYVCVYDLIFTIETERISYLYLVKIYWEMR